LLIFDFVLRRLRAHLLKSAIENLKSGGYAADPGL